MIKVENLKVYNLANAVYSARNPLQSWEKSTSDQDSNTLCDADLDLAKRLYRAGSPDRKYMRQIFVSMDITAPVYWLQELDTYKVATVRNSTSLQHTGGRRDFTVDDFSFESLSLLDKLDLVRIANKYRQRYADDKTPENLMALRQSIPMAYNYMITWTANYEVCATIIEQRFHHRLQEWRTFCDIMLRELPYLHEIMGDIE